MHSRTILRVANLLEFGHSRDEIRSILGDMCAGEFYLAYKAGEILFSHRGDDKPTDPHIPVIGANQ